MKITFIENRKTNKRHFYFTSIVLFFVASFSVIGLIYVLNFGNLIGQNIETTVLSNSLYTLRGNPTDYQKDLFKELSNSLKNQDKDDVDLSSKVVQNFVADYFTWSNKKGSYDVGGRDFTFAIEGLNFYKASRNNFYNYMEKYLLNGYATSELPTVVNVIIDSQDYAAIYEYYGEKYLTFYIEASWTYEIDEESSIDLSVFPTKGYFTVVKTNEGRYEIARFY